MSVMAYQNSNLWKKFLAAQNTDVYEAPRTRLRLCFEKTRQAIIPLVAKISNELPSLTIHNIEHLDALWHIADVLVTDEMNLNPAETFVLGMAFLMHDAATSSFAFSGGISGVKGSIQWKDYIAQKELTEELLLPGSVVYQTALFETLRVLHAGQAKNLLTHKWKDLGGIERYLVEDIELRNHYGRVIGEISASHGEEPAAVESRWAHVPPVSAHSSLGLDSKATWSVDTLKIALLLRCVDAAHIDSLRAPDMEACLLNLTGESKHHWIFQNKLGSIAINDKNELYWSGSAFDKEEADAWWRCYDTCRMIDREISTANRILTDNNRKPLRAIGVMGAKDPAIFLKNVPVEAWQPVDFSFQVSQVGNVIEKFGGEKLYGSEGHWALRELIQNAADAIRARRIYTSKPAHGQIKVCLRFIEESWWLDVQDDGIGMTRYIMTDILLDFGRSLWKDSALRSQWSGLSSKGFTSVGQFGIGFFSVFMLGDEVKVTTWAHGKGSDQQLTLHLRNRVHERPLILTPEFDEQLSDFGTRVSIRLSKGRKGVLRSFDRLVDYKKTSVEEPLSQLVGWLAPALDIDLYSQDGGGEEEKVVQANDWINIDSRKLLRRLLPRLPDNTVLELGGYLRDIKEVDGSVVGRALIDPNRSVFLSDREATLVHRGVYAAKGKGICGILVSSNNGDLARQNATPIASADAITNWANTQMNNSVHDAPTLAERGVSLGVNSSKITIGRVAGDYVTIEQIVDRLCVNDSPLILLTSWPDCPENMPQSDFDNLELFENVVDLTYCNAETRFDFQLKKWLEEILPEGDNAPRTVFDLLLHKAQIEITSLDVEDEDIAIGTVGEVELSKVCTVLRILS
jgi:hypothetical protein